MKGFPKLGVLLGRDYRGIYRVLYGYIGRFKDSGFGFPKIKGTFSGVHIIRTTLFCGSTLGSSDLGKLPYLQISSVRAASTTHI